MKDLFLWICAAPSLIGFAMVISLGIWGLSQHLPTMNLKSSENAANCAPFYYLINNTA